jgi:imidazole glycerol-phosphate synthase subunit HisF
MHPIRIIPRLDIKGSDVVKGIQLEGVRRVGLPGELARKYYAEGADEIIFIDSVASLYGRNSILSVIEDTAKDVFVPLTVGGGLRSVDDIRLALRSGADKVALNTAAVHRPDLIREAAETFGSQCIVLSVQAMKREDQSWEVYTDNARERTHKNISEWIEEAVDKGAGEILLTSINQEGSKRGFDLELYREIYSLVDVPIIACGGAGESGHVVQLIQDECVDAVACAAIFHYGHTSIQELKHDLSTHNITVRR